MAHQASIVAEEAFEGCLVGDDEGIEVSSDSGSSVMTIDDVELSLKGIILLINNQWAEAEELFKQYRSVIMNIHYC